jgi:hypothetical protein
MRLQLFLCSLFLFAGYVSFGQNITGTWHGFQVNRDKGQYKEYRVTVDFKMLDDNVTGTMQVKSPQKGVITSSFTGTYDKKDNLLYLNENEIITEGITSEDARLCSFILKVKKNMLKGKGRSRAKGYDHLMLRLERKEAY